MYKKDLWNLMKKSGKRRYIFLNATLYRMFPIGLVLLIIFELFERGSNFYTYENFVTKLITVIIVFIFYGGLVGNIEWKFYNDTIKNISAKKRRYFIAFLEGILNWGIPIAIVLFISEQGGITDLIPLLFIWLIIGFIYGLVVTRKFEWK